MSQDIVSDVLNMIMNAKRAGKKELEIKRSSKLLLEVLGVMKKQKYIDFKKEEDKITIDFKDLIECRAIKPRYNVNKSNIDKYFRRYLPSVDMGIIIISTNKGLITHHEAFEKNIGGSLIAYFY